MKSYAVIVSLIGALAAGPVARAQEAVWDPEEIARLAEKSATLATALSRLVDLVNQTNDLGRTLGRFGALAHLDFTKFDMDTGLQGAGPQLSAVASALTGTTAIRSYADAAAFVAKLRTLPPGGDKVSKATQVTAALDSLRRLAGEDGFALSLYTRQSLPDAPSRADQLVAQASGASDLRSDIAANSAAGLAVLDQLTSLHAMLAVILEIQATQRLRQAPPPSASAGGSP